MFNRSVILVSLLPVIIGCSSNSDNLANRSLRTTGGVLSDVGNSTGGFLRRFGQELGNPGSVAAERELGRTKEICLEAGLKEGTSEYTKCFIEIKKAQLSRPVVNNNTSNTYKAPDDAPALNLQPGQRPVSCTSRKYGNQIRTDCN